MPVNASNIKNFPFLTPKGYPRVGWVVFTILQLHRTAIENASIGTIDIIDTIGRLDCIDQYKDNI